MPEDGLKVPIGLDVSGFLAGVRGVQASLGGLGTSLVALGGIAAGAFAFREADQFNASLLRIRANARDTNLDLAALGDSLLETSTGALKNAFAQSDLAEALGEVVNEAENAGEALKIVEAAGRLAQVSGKDLTETSKVLADVLSAYQMPASEAAHATQILYEASRQTGTAIDELGASMAGARPLAEALGLDFEESAALSGVLKDAGVDSADALLKAWTKAGGSGGLPDLLAFIQKTMADTAATTVDNSEKIAELSSRKEDLADSLVVATQRISEFTAETAESTRIAAEFSLAKTRRELVETDAELATVIAEHGKVDEAAKTTQEVLVDAFGRGGAAALALVQREGELATVQESLKSNTDSLNDAFSGSVSKSQAAKNQFHNLTIELGEQLLPAVNAVLSVFAGFFAFLQEHRLVFDLLVSVVIGLTTALVALKVATIAQAIANSTLWVSLAPILPIILAVSAAIAAGYFVWQNWTAIVDGAKISFEWFANLLLEFSPTLQAIVFLFQNFGEVVDYVRNAFSSISEVMAVFALALVEVGKQLVQGLIDGIKGAATGAVDAIVGVGSDMVEGLQDFLGIHSPSTVGAEIGENFTDGIALGIENGTGAVEAAAESAAARATARANIIARNVSQATAAAPRTTTSRTAGVNGWETATADRAPTLAEFLADNEAAITDAFFNTSAGYRISFGLDADKVASHLSSGDSGLGIPNVGAWVGEGAGSPTYTKMIGVLKGLITQTLPSEQWDGLLGQLGVAGFAHGVEGLITRPGLFYAGEHGAESISIRPTAVGDKQATESKTVIVQPGAIVLNGRQADDFMRQMRRLGLSALG